MSTGERRRELDGLRGIAILLVLIGHAGYAYGLPSFATAGVTLFFALSGYLITEILVTERERTGRLNLRRFYARRMTRLAPPLYVMLLAVAIAGAADFRSLATAATWTANYASMYANHDVGHTWSLAVEEQFYLLWPLVLCLLPRARAVAIMCWVVFALMVWRGMLLSEGLFVYAYYALEAAGSAILAGCLVALARFQLRPAFVTVGLVGVLGISIGAGATGGLYFVPWLVTPFAAGMVAAAARCRWLTWRPLTVFGVTSYSVYLWHEPVSHLISGGLAPVGVLVGAAVGAVAYLLVEAPLMRWRARSVVATEATEAVLLRGHRPDPAYAGVVAAEVLPERR